MFHFILLLFICLMTISCNNSHYSHLQSIDQVININTDSALNLINKINPDDLSANEAAYYSLLSTSIQYKKYLPIPDDSIINIAVEYYTDHFDQDKLTRSLMYKGAVLTDLNFNKQALESYKEAEKIADTTNNLTMGLLNFRIGELYQKSFIDNDEHINRYKIAAKYFQKTNYRHFEISTLLTIGQQYITKNKDSAQIYLNKAINLATHINDTQLINEVRMMFVKFYNYHNIFLNKAKNIALSVHNNEDSIITGRDLYSEIAILYAKLGKIDSAKYYTEKFPISTYSSDTMRYYMILEEIAIHNKDFKTAYLNQKKANKMADSLVKAGNSKGLFDIEKKFDNTIANERAERLRQGNIIRNYTILTVILSFIIIAIYWYLLWKRKKRVISNNKNLIDRLQSEIKLQQSATQDVLSRNLETIQSLNETIEEKVILEKSLKDIISDRMSITCQLMNIKYKFEDRPDKFLKQFDDIILINKKSRKECDNIIKIANHLNAFVIDHIAALHTNLSYSDLLLLSLICLEFSNIEMKVFLNSPNMEAMYATRYRLAKKLQTSSLETYIDNAKKMIFMENKLNKSAL